MEDRPAAIETRQQTPGEDRTPPAVQVRPLCLDDAPEIQTLLGRLAGLPATNLPDVIHPEAGANYVRMAAGGWELTQWAPLAIEHDGSFSGLIVLEPDPLCEPGEWVLFYYIQPELWGRGIATGAVRLMLDLAFHHIGLTSVCARCLSDHRASLRVLEKTGFIPAGSLRNEGRYGTRTAGQEITILRCQAHRSAPSP